MAVKRSPLKLPTTTVVAPQQRSRNLTMLQPGFYQQLAQPSQQRTQRPAVIESIRQHERPTPSVGQQEVPSTQEHFSSQLERIRQQGPAPELQPGARVKSPDASLVQPDQFRAFYDELSSIGRIGQQTVATERAKQQFQQMQRLQEVLSRGVQPYQSPRLQGGYDQQSIGRSAQLSMLGDVKPYVRKAAQEISGKFGYSNIGGHATSGHIPGSDHYTGKALDVMGGNQSLANWAIRNAGRLGVKYIIHNRRYWDPSQGWVRYTGSNPHTGHVHISFH